MLLAIGLRRASLAASATIALATLLLAPVRASQAAASLIAQVELTLKTGRSVPAEGAVVWIPGVSASVGSATRSMTSKGKRFLPHVLTAASGQTVDFPNADAIFHNAFSLSPGAEFDLGLYRRGASKPVAFKKPGVVRVYCNIHPDMAGFVVVTDGSAAGVTGPDGRVALEGLPPGEHTVRVWTETGGEANTKVTLAAGPPQTWPVRLDASAYRKQAHKNKHGRDYPRGADRY